ncbi:MAG: hypothetical protein ACRD0A_10775 [Acidimicrobiales bacterium]
MGWKWLSVVLCAGVVCVATSCNGDDEAGGSTATEATTTMSTTTTTTMPTTTTVAVAGPAPWNEIVADLYRQLGELTADPDPSRVVGIVAEECECYALILQGVEGLASRGERIVGQSPQPVALKTEGRTDLPQQGLTVRLSDGPSQRLDATGAVINEIPAAPDSCVSMLVAPSGPGGAYRIHDLFDVQRCPDGL